MACAIRCLGGFSCAVCELAIMLRWSIGSVQSFGNHEDYQSTCIGAGPHHMLTCLAGLTGILPGGTQEA